MYDYIHAGRTFLKNPLTIIISIPNVNNMYMRESRYLELHGTYLNFERSEIQEIESSK